MKNIKILNGTSIKFIAAFLMLLDHIHQMFYYVGVPIWLTMLGRLVFPMFLFISADSFHYTRNKYKFLKRLLIASLFMSASTFIISQALPNEKVVLMNNAFSTFLIVGVYTLSIDKFKSGIKNRKVKDIFASIFWFVLPVLTMIPSLFMTTLFSKIFAIQNPVLKTVAMFFNYMIVTFPSILTAEGGVLMVGLGVAFYLFRDHRILQCLSLAAVSGFVYYTGNSLQALMIFAIIPMMLYNGKKGKGVKDFFYIFYPAHIYILYIISTLFFAK